MSSKQIIKHIPKSKLQLWRITLSFFKSNCIFILWWISAFLFWQFYNLVFFILIIRSAFTKLLIPSSSNFSPSGFRIYSVWCVLKLLVTQHCCLRHHPLCQNCFTSYTSFWCCLVGKHCIYYQQHRFKLRFAEKEISHLNLTSVCAVTSVGNSESPFVNFLLKFWLFDF